MFKRALAAAGGHGGALFGLAEAYRDAGDKEKALDQYRRYLDADSGGRDAPAARRQIKDLEKALGAGGGDRDRPHAIAPLPPHEPPTSGDPAPQTEPPAPSP